jgi:hypothetical protein
MKLSDPHQKLTLALEWELSKHGMVLDGPSDHDLEPVEEIREGIDSKHDEKLLLVSPIGSASMKN